MNNIMKFVKTHKNILYIFIIIFIIFDVCMAFYGDLSIRLIINYLLIPILAIITISLKSKGYILLVVYELFLSIVSILNVPGVEIFTYFVIPDFWQFVNHLNLHLSDLGVPLWLHSIALFVIVSFFTLICVRRKQHKKVDNSF